MVEIFKTIKGIFEDIKNKLPDILNAKSIPDFKVYQIGYPTDDNKTCLSVRYGDHQEDIDIDFIFIVQLQLVSVGETDVYKYIDSFIEYLKTKFFVFEFGFQNFSYKTFLEDDYGKRTPIAIIEIKMEGKGDDCGNM